MRKANGFTSQAVAVIDALREKNGCLLMDEDLSAENFMSRDMGMRALIQDKRITPLLYRFFGHYDKVGVSTIVVVGSVGNG